MSFEKDLEISSEESESRKSVDRVVVISKGGNLPPSSRVLSLFHPRTGGIASFILHNKTILEVQRSTKPRSSWFVDNSCLKDGILYICTPIDPMFLMLPVLECCRGKNNEHPGYFREELEFLSEEGFSGIRHLLHVADYDLNTLCDVQEFRGRNVFRLSDDKVLRWLRIKVDRIGRTVIAHFPNLIQNKSFKASCFRGGDDQCQPEINKDAVLSTALGFLSEYLSVQWLQLLSKSYGMEKFEVPVGKTLEVPQRSAQTVDAKRTRESEGGFNRDVKRDSFAARKGKRQKLDKESAARSMKITSFFALKK